MILDVPVPQRFSLRAIHDIKFSMSLFMTIPARQGENIFTISTTSVGLNVDLEAIDGDIHNTVQIISSPSNAYLHCFCSGFEFNFLQVDMVEAV